MRGMARAVAFGLAIAFLAGACGGAGTGGTAGTSSPAASAATRPKFEVQTFMYSIQVKGKLRVGTQEDNPPFSVKNPTNSKWEGFDTDIGREIAKAIFGTQGDPDSFIEWVPVTSATRIPSLTDNKADVIIKTFTINEDRKKQIDFSDVYFSTGQRILVKKTNDQIKEVVDLGGKTFCAQRGSTSEQNVTKAPGGEGAPPRQLPRVSAGAAAGTSGRRLDRRDHPVWPREAGPEHEDRRQVLFR